MCLPLLDVLNEALEKRFGKYFDDEYYLLAASFHPQFRLSWLPWYFDEPTEVHDRMKRKMIELLESSANDVSEATMSSDTDNDFDGDTSDTFFASLFSQSKRRTSSHADRVQEFLSSAAPKQIDANSFVDEKLKQLFIKYNTAVPSSAAVERLFSVGKDILKPKRCGLTDEHFEMLAFLKGN